MFMLAHHFHRFLHQSCWAKTCDRFVL